MMQTDQHARTRTQTRPYGMLSGNGIRNRNNMGTNYYLHEEICTCCKHYNERHIGKSSGGWCFSLHVYPEDGINDLEDWKRKFGEASEVWNEYGEKISIDMLLQIITERSWPQLRDVDADYWEQFHRDNHSENGPNNLLRHSIMDGHCISHGSGTWDLIIGDFS